MRGFSTLLLLVIIGLVWLFVLPLPHFNSDQGISFDPPVGLKLISWLRSTLLHQQPTPNPVASPSPEEATIIPASSPKPTPRLTESGQVCAQEIVFATDPQKTECHQYSTVCDIPEGFIRVAQCPSSPRIINCSSALSCPTGYYCKKFSQDPSGNGICFKS